MQSKEVLICVVQWDDAGTSRINIAGWSDCPHQREQIRQQAMDDLPASTVEAVWFMEIQVPLLTAPGSPAWQRVQQARHRRHDRDEE